MRGNLLSEIMPEVLHPMPSIKALDLADNPFSVLPLDGIQAIEATLESVSFEGKPNTNSFFTSFDGIWVRGFPTGYVSSSQEEIILLLLAETSKDEVTITLLSCSVRRQIKPNYVALGIIRFSLFCKV